MVGVIASYAGGVPVDVPNCALVVRLFRNQSQNAASKITTASKTSAAIRLEPDRLNTSGARAMKSKERTNISNRMPLNTISEILAHSRNRSKPIAVTMPQQLKPALTILITWLSVESCRALDWLTGTGAEGNFMNSVRATNRFTPLPIKTITADVVMKAERLLAMAVVP
jgi:hypothetical protein